MVDLTQQCDLGSPDISVVVGTLMNQTGAPDTGDFRLRFPDPHLLHTGSDCEPAAIN